MSYRITNNVGYKKLYPMSLTEDDSFCHYCGQKANIEVQLEWDHVPALNVSIPDHLKDIKKTLIRSCNECNRLASDIPHLDYLERHLWLKGALLRRYKRLLLSFDGTNVSTDGLDYLLAATINNGQFRYEETMRRIGFGIRDISDIDSPILQLKNKEKKKLSEALTAFMYGIPTEDDEDETSSVNLEGLESALEIKQDLPPFSYTQFLNFLASEIESGQKIYDDNSYFTWCKRYPSRTEILELPNISPSKFFGKKWDKIKNDASKLVSDDQIEEPELSTKPHRISTGNTLTIEKKTSQNKKPRLLNTLEKRRKIYEIHGKNYHIKQIGIIFVFYKCKTHGEQRSSIEDMLKGYCCCST